MDIPDIVDTLSATPVWLAAGLRNLPEDLARQAPVSPEWSPIQILAHLRASDAIMAPRVVQVLTRPQAPLAGFDERAWARVVERAGLPLDTQLAAFQARRAELVGVLRALSAQEWEIAGQHETRGTLTIRTIATDLLSMSMSTAHSLSPPWPPCARQDTMQSPG